MRRVHGHELVDCRDSWILLIAVYLVSRRLLGLAALGLVVVTGCSDESARIDELESKIASARIAQLEDEVQRLTGGALTREDSSDSGSSAAQPTTLSDHAGSEDMSALEPGPEIDYAQQYLDWVAPSNCAWQITYDQETAIIGSDGVFYEDEWASVGPQLRAAYRPAAESLQNSINASSSLVWPAELQNIFDGAVVEASEWAGILFGLAEAGSIYEWQVMTERAINFPGRTQASLLRSKLGLPTNFGDETDWCAFIRS